MRTVDVWRASLDGPAKELAALANLLSAEERGRASLFHREIDRSRYIASRATLRILISEYISIPPTIVQLRVVRGGKPSLEAKQNASGIHFNLSHCGGLALFAFSSHAIGIDVQHVETNDDIPRIVANFFSPTEVASFERLEESEREVFFFRTWVRKEAYLKATGSGLRTDPAELCVGDSDGEATLTDRNGETRIDHAKKVFDIAGLSDHVAAIAVATPLCPPSIRIREYRPVSKALPKLAGQTRALTQTSTTTGQKSAALPISGTHPGRR